MMSWFRALSLRKQMLLAYWLLDLPFVPALPVSFIAMNNLWETGEVPVLLRWFAIVYVLKTILWAAVVWWAMTPVDHWHEKYRSGAAFTDDELTAAARRANRFPYFFLPFWSLIWGGQYAIIFLDSDRLPVATEYPTIIVPFCVTVGIAAGVFNIPFNSVLLADVSGAMSLALRRRGLTVSLLPDSIRARLVVITMGIATSATGWMICVSYAIEIRNNAHDLQVRGRMLREDVTEHMLRHLLSNRELDLAAIQGAMERLRGKDPLVHPFAVFDGDLVIDAGTSERLRGALSLLYTAGNTEEVEKRDPRLHLAISAERINERIIVGAVVDVQPHASELYLFGVVFFFIVVCIFAPMVAYLIGRALADPVGSVGAALDGVTRTQDFTGLDRVPVFRPDELGALSGRANEMIDALERIWADNKAHLRDVVDKAADLERARADLAVINADLVAAAKAKSQFLASMSHELRTPLNAIIGFSRMVLKKTEGMIPEQQQKNLKLINESGQALLALVNDLLDFERIEAGRLKISIEDVDVDNVVGTLEDTLRPQAERKGMTLATRVEGPLTVRTDPDRLRQILINFVNNSIKYSERGHVELAVTRDDKHVTFAIKDEGVGIAADQLQRIFEPFHQIDGGFARERDGVGLGLAIVRRLAEMLGGTVSVTSTVGVGSTFSLLLPASAIVMSPAASPATPAPSPTTASVRVEVVIVEDDEATAALLEQHLQDKKEPGVLGFRVRRAKTPKEAIAQFDRAMPDAVVLDLSLPGVDDGFGVLENLRARSTGAQTQVVVYTARDLADLDGARLTRHRASVVQKGDAGADLVAAALRAAIEQKLRM